MLFKKISEVAKEFGIRTQYIYYYILRGEIEAVEVEYLIVEKFVGITNERVLKLIFIDIENEKNLNKLKSMQKNGKKVSGKNRK